MKLWNALRSPLALIGYCWGIAIPVLMVALFFGLNEWSFRFSQLPFMRIHPRYSGGEVIRRIETDGARYSLHRVVTDGLIGNRKEGFVQVDVTVSETTIYPLETSFDFDSDGIADFRLRFVNADAASPTLETYTRKITGLGQHARTADGWVIRLEFQDTR